ncbi:hypothetical protein PIB30_087363, partial [Stylosanthes scabra]|nr:hypothetical protein [Stylosanthes scabra]
PIAIIDRRTVESPSGSRTQVLVDWEGMSRDETSWEDIESLKKLFPNIDLEDKVIVEGGIVDRPDPSHYDTEPSPPEQPIIDDAEVKTRPMRNRKQPDGCVTM